MLGWGISSAASSKTSHPTRAAIVGRNFFNSADLLFKEVPVEFGNPYKHIGALQIEQGPFVRWLVVSSRRSSRSPALSPAGREPALSDPECNEGESNGDLARIGQVAVEGHGFSHAKKAPTSIKAPMRRKCHLLCRADLSLSPPQQAVADVPDNAKVTSFFLRSSTSVTCKRRPGAIE